MSDELEKKFRRGNFHLGFDWRGNNADVVGRLSKQIHEEELELAKVEGGERGEKKGNDK